MDATITTFTDADSWNRALYAFLAEKERRSGSRRTVEGYSRMLRLFFGTAAVVMALRFATTDHGRATATRMLMAARMRARLRTSTEIGL